MSGVLEKRLGGLDMMVVRPRSIHSQIGKGKFSRLRTAPGGIPVRRQRYSKPHAQTAERRPKGREFRVCSREMESNRPREEPGSAGGCGGRRQGSLSGSLMAFLNYRARSGNASFKLPALPSIAESGGSKPRKAVSRSALFHPA
jgi:hypothetical protein